MMRAIWWVRRMWGLIEVGVVVYVGNENVRQRLSDFALESSGELLWIVLKFLWEGPRFFSFGASPTLSPGSGNSRPGTLGLQLFFSLLLLRLFLSGQFRQPIVC